MRPERLGPFASAGEAAAALAEFFAAFAFPRSELSAEAIAREPLDSAWLKAASRKRAGAAAAYERWAGESVPKMVKSARYVINQEQFDILVRRTGLDLLRSWRGSFPDKLARLAYGEAFRAVDLLFMAINESEACRSVPVQGFLHVPLDASTLRPLRSCIDELVDRDFSLEIPAAPSAGFVATEEHYLLFQEAVFALAERAGVPPIAYAYFCAGPSPS
jgi:hypothetical protein